MDMGVMVWFVVIALGVSALRAVVARRPASLVTSLLAAAALVILVRSVGLPAVPLALVGCVALGMAVGMAMSPLGRRRG